MENEYRVAKLRKIPPNPSVIFRDTYYLIVNGMYEVRTWALKVSDLFLI